MSQRFLRVAMDARFLSSPVLRGMDRYTVGLARALIRLGVQITLFHRAREPLHLPHLAGIGCEVEGLADRRVVHWEQMVVPMALWRGKFDVYHAPAERGVPWLAPCPVVLTIHSVTDQSYRDLVRRRLLPGPVRNYLGYDVKLHDRRFWPTYHRMGFARANHILTPSEFARSEVIRFLGMAPDRVTTTHLAVHEQFLKAPNSGSVRAETLRRLGVRQPYLLYVGGFEPHKNVPGLLEAFALVRAARPELTLVAVGSKNLPQTLLAKAEQLNLNVGRDIVFLVNVTDDLNDLYDSALLFVTLSWRETFCLPALEAMTRSLPVVASKWGASPEIVGAAGCLIDPRDLASCKNAILDLLTSSDRTPRAEAARLRADQFSWDTAAQQTLAVYNRLVGPRRNQTSAVSRPRHSCLNGLQQPFPAKVAAKIRNW